MNTRKVFLFLFWIFFFVSQGALANDSLENTPETIFKIYDTDYPYGKQKNAEIYKEFTEKLQVDLPLNQGDTAFPYKVILVRGLLTRIYPQLLGAIGKAMHLPPGFVDAFYDAKAWLNSQGIEAEILPSNTEKDSAFNAAELAEEISKSSKPVMVLTHCKGSTDFLHALVNYPDIRKKIAGWASIQAPFYGSKLLDKMNADRVTHATLSRVLVALGGDEDALFELGEEPSQQYLQENKEEIASLLKDFPMISVGSRFTPPPVSAVLTPFKKRSFLDPLNNVLKAFGDAPNDGLVPTMGTCLLGTPCLFLDNFDHSGPVMSLAPFYSIPTEMRIRFAWTLLSMLRSRIPG